MELIPYKGIDSIYFGLTQSEVLSILGEPDKIFSDEDEPDEIIYQYNQQKLSLTFYDNENGRLGYIRCSDPGITFQGKKIIALPITKVQKEVFSNLGEDWEAEYYDFFDTYFNEEFWLTLNVEYDEITDLEIGVPVNLQDEFEWPA